MISDDTKMLFLNYPPIWAFWVYFRNRTHNGKQVTKECQWLRLAKKNTITENKDAAVWIMKMYYEKSK
jgi:hypothetical protein